MAASKVNMCGSPGDAHQRYKRQVAVLQHVKGKNQTFLMNSESLSKSLDRSLEFIAKYFSSELACKVKIVKNEIVLNGIFTVQAIEEKLLSLTSQYVLCNICSNPETKLNTKKGVMHMHCIACGADSEVKKCDEKIFKLVTSLQPKKSKRLAKVTTTEDTGEVVWNTDASDEASSSRRSMLSQHASSLTQC